MLIGLTYDLREDYLDLGLSEEDTAEFDAPETIAALEEALRQLGHQPERIGNIRRLVPRLAEGRRWDLVFNIAEGLGGFGRESQVPALLEAYGIPYTFSDPMVLGLSLHKGMTKHVVRDAGIATPVFAVVSAPEEVAGIDLPFPLFCKPVAEGTSKGISAISRVDSREALEHSCRVLLERFHQPVLVEGYLPGREFTVGILGTGARARVLGVLEVSLQKGAEEGAYSFHNKEHYEALVDYQLSRGSLADRVAETALAVWHCLGCRDAGRVDIRLDAAGHAHFLEANPLAGLHPVRSDLVILSRQLGLPYLELIRAILESAMERLDEPRLALGPLGGAGPEVQHARQS